MECGGAGMQRKFLVLKIVNYLNWKGAKTCKEKESAYGTFMASNEKTLRKEFCRQHCPLRQTCSLRR